MKRRNFLRNSLIGTAALASGPASVTAGEIISETPAGTSFKLKYAPHDGMFRHSAGDDILDQLRFMADQGFAAFEDNGMSGRDTSTQEKMAALMSRLNIQMGVFVAHKIYWSEPNLASGNADKRKEFLEDIRKSVEIAKRVNAKWVTVVPGFKDLRQDMGFQT
ncbi:MAG: TIM barrel protein, partial [Bacteroidota bacterium]